MTMLFALLNSQYFKLLFVTWFIGTCSKFSMLYLLKLGKFFHWLQYKCTQNLLNVSLNSLLLHKKGHYGSRQCYAVLCNTKVSRNYICTIKVTGYRQLKGVWFMQQLFLNKLLLLVPRARSRV